MPNFDGTGPDGKGPMTGRGSGYCVVPLNTTAQELDFLKNQKKSLLKQINILESRIANLEPITTGGKK